MNFESLKGWIKIMKVLLALVLLSSLSDAANPGLKLSVGRKALQYAADKVVNELKKKVLTLKLPNLATDSLRVEDVKITLFLNPSASVSIDPGRGMVVELRTGEVRAQAKAALKMWWFWLNAGIEVYMSSARMSLTTAITNSQGKPFLYSSSCSANVQDFRVKSIGSVFGWAFSNLIQVYKNDIQARVETEICKGLTFLINVEANKQLASFNLVATLKGGILLDYHLTSNPLFLTDRVLLYHKGTALKDPQANINPPPFSLIPNRTTSAALSEDSFNSICRAAYARQLFNFERSVDDKKLLPTSNTNVYTSFNTSTPTVVSITPNGILLSMQYETVFTGPEVLMQVHGNYTGLVRVWWQKNSIKASVSASGHQVALIYSSFPSTSTTTTKVKEFIGKMIESRINTLLQPGWTLPQIGDVRYTKFSVLYADKEMMVGIELV